MNESPTSLFIVSLKFTEKKARAPELMDEHVLWIRQGLSDEVFLCAGSLPDKQGGVLLACGLTREALERRLGDDPFVKHGVVTAEVVPVSVGLVQERARFLFGSAS